MAHQSQPMSGDLDETRLLPTTLIANDVIGPQTSPDRKPGTTADCGRGLDMGYLFVKLLPWILCSLALGIAMGWVACKQGEHEPD